MTDDASEPAACASCGAALRPRVVFCEACGARTGAGTAPVSPVPPTRPRAPSPAAGIAHRAMLRNRAKANEADNKAIRSARVCMAIVALLVVATGIFSWDSLNTELAKLHSNGLEVNEAVVGQLRAVLVAHFILAAIFVGLVIWAGRNAFAATLTGLVLWIALQLAAAALNPISLVQGIIIKIIVVVVMAGGIRAALQQRQRAKVRVPVARTRIPVSRG